MTEDLTAGNTDDRNKDIIESLTKNMFGKLFGDKGYISQKLFRYLLSKNITLVTKIKKGMNNKLMDLTDKILLRKRALIESVNDFLKNQCQIEHISGLCAYSFIPKKPSLNINRHFIAG